LKRPALGSPQNQARLQQAKRERDQGTAGREPGVLGKRPAGSCGNGSPVLKRPTLGSSQARIQQTESVREQGTAGGGFGKRPGPEFDSGSPVQKRLALGSPQKQGRSQLDGKNPATVGRERTEKRTRGGEEREGETRAGEGERRGGEKRQGAKGGVQKTEGERSWGEAKGAQTRGVGVAPSRIGGPSMNDLAADAAEKRASTFSRSPSSDQGGTRISGSSKRMQSTELSDRDQPAKRQAVNIAGTTNKDFDSRLQVKLNTDMGRERCKAAYRTDDELLWDDAL
jgi:hypothetical protein